MKRPSQIFHALSYLQYPLRVIALIYMVLMRQGADAEERFATLNTVLALK